MKKDESTPEITVINTDDCIECIDSINTVKVEHCLNSTGHGFIRHFYLYNEKLMEVNYSTNGTPEDTTFAIFKGSYFCTYRYREDGSVYRVSDKFRDKNGINLNRINDFDEHGNQTDSLGRGLVIEKFSEFGDSVLLSGIIWDGAATSSGEIIIGYSVYVGDISIVMDTARSLFKRNNINVLNGKFVINIPNDLVTVDELWGGNILLIREHVIRPDGQNVDYKISVPFVDPLFTKDYKFPYHALKNSYKNILQYLDSRKEEIFNPESFKQ